MTRSLRPLPRSSTCGCDLSNWRSFALTPVTSETRAPVRARNNRTCGHADHGTSLDWARNEGIHFGLGEMMRHLDVRPFYGNR